MGRVEGKVAIVTGAAGGIGAATARLLAENGARVVLADLDFEGAQNEVSSIRSAGYEATAIRFDLGEEDSITTLIDRTCGEYGGLDVLHNNAAATRLAATDDAPLSGARAAVWDETLRINVRGTMLATRLAAARMIQRGGGSIINMSSAASLRGDLGHAAYGASKAAINTLTLYAAAEFGKQGVRVNAIAPGLIVTEVSQVGQTDSSMAMLEANHLTPRLGLPIDVAYMVLYLASDESTFITGSVLPVDGGIVSTVPYLSELRAMIPSDSSQ